MKKILLLLLTLILCFGLFACGGSDEPRDSTDPTETVSEDGGVPSIKGSQAYDIVLSLEDTGIPKADAETTSDGFRFSSSTSEYSYDIETNNKHEVMCAQFMVLSGNDNGYLGFCGSMPYDSSDSSAQQWVNDNVGTEASKTFGDAIYSLSVGSQGPILTIKATGYDDYVMEILSE